MEVSSNLTFSEPAQTLDEEQHNAVERVDDEENDEKFRELVFYEEEDVLVPVILDDFEDTARLILRGQGQKVHHTYVSLSGFGKTRMR